QPVRLPHPTAAARRGACRVPRALDAVELPGLADLMRDGSGWADRVARLSTQAPSRELISSPGDPDGAGGGLSRPDRLQCPISGATDPVIATVGQGNECGLGVPSKRPKPAEELDGSAAGAVVAVAERGQQRRDALVGERGRVAGFVKKVVRQGALPR